MGRWKNALLSTVLSGTTALFGCKSQQQKVHVPFGGNEIVALDTLRKPDVPDLGDVVMEIDTSYSKGMSSLQKELARSAYEKSDEFLQEKGIELKVEKGAGIKLEFSNVRDFLDFRLGGLTEIKPFEGGLQEFNRTVQAENRVYKNSKLEVSFYNGFLAGKDSLVLPEGTVTNKNLLWKLAYHLPGLGGAQRRGNISVNVPANIHTEYAKLLRLNKDGGKMNLIDAISSSTVHELGHEAGLIHPVKFPNVVPNQNDYFPTGSGYNVMGSRTFPPNVDFENYYYSLSDLQTYLWKQGLTKGTMLSNVLARTSKEDDLAPLLDYYDETFSDADPRAYIGE